MADAESLGERSATRLAAIVVHNEDRAVAFWRTTGWLAQSNGVWGYYVWRAESRAGQGRYQFQLQRP